MTQADILELVRGMGPVLEQLVINKLQDHTRPLTNRIAALEAALEAANRGK